MDIIKNKYGWSGLWTLKSTESRELDNEINGFFVCCYKFIQIKRTFKILGVGMVKSGCGKSSDETLKLIISQEWTNGINWFFACWYKFQQAKSLFSDSWVGVVKNGSGIVVHDVPKICSILKMNLWIELIFWMLIVM